ncbi:hypothetical protein INT47_010252 [Mucor saturninus]|uniref:Uncharacterized protein n=1 Tax=Mucor saturninus TaxID=64648 RepID=A0A8H7RCA9_9FUNG|nr:hypothetical protein INT47_010252 [Mucor saturninus]
MFAIHKACPNLSKTNTTLKRLRISVLTIPENYSRYTANCISTQTYTIHLTLGTSLNLWVNAVGISNAVNLTKRLGTVVGTTLAFSVNRMGNRDVYYEFMYQDKTGGSIDNLKLSYLMKDSDYYRRNDKGHVAFEIALSDTRRSIIGPDVSRDLSVDLRNPNPKFLAAFLKYAIQNCSNLESFKFYGLSRKDLYFRTSLHYNPNSSNFPKDSTAVKKKKKGLTVAIGHKTLPPDDMLGQLSFYFPYIGLYMVAVRRDIPQEEYLEERDVSVFRNSELLYLDIDVLMHKSIHVLYTDGEEVSSDFQVLYSSNHNIDLKILEEKKRIRKIRILFSIIRRNKITTIIISMNFYQSSLIAAIENGQLHD